MIPHAKFAFNWEEAGGEYYNVNDLNSIVYADGSTLSKKTVKSLGLPVVKSIKDEEDLIHQMNALILKI